MTIIALLALLTGSLTEAQRNYENGLFEDALDALGPTCDGSADPVRCEELRAFVHVAIGEDAEAAQAFERMLVREPTASLSRRVAPKIRSLFDDRQAAIATLLNAEIESVAWDGGNAPVPVRFVPRGDIELTAVTLILRPDTDVMPQRVPMRYDAGTWIGMAVIEDPKRARYALEVEIAAGAMLALKGISPTTPLPLSEFALDEERPDNFLSDPDRDDTDDDDEELPEWAFWSIIGGSVLVGGVVAALLLTSGSSEGDLQVNVTFDGDPP